MSHTHERSKRRPHFNSNIYRHRFWPRHFCRLIGFDHDMLKWKYFNWESCISLTLKEIQRDVASEFPLNRIDCKSKNEHKIKIYSRLTHRSKELDLLLIHWFLSLDFMFNSSLCFEFTLPIPAAWCSDEETFTILKKKHPLD